MPNANTPSVPLARMLSRRTPGAAARRVEPQSRWWLRAASVLVMGYVVASQSLMEVEQWSRAGFAIAVLLAVLLGFGRIYGIYRFGAGRWLWFPGMFVCYCVLRGLAGSEYSNPVDVLSTLASAYLGGIGVAAALQAGVPFRALVYAQVLSILCQMAAVRFGMGTDPGPDETELRYAGLTGNANEFGLQFTLGACLIWLLPKQSGFWACLFSFGAVAYGLVTSGSRQALLAVPFFAVLVLVNLFYTIRKGRRLIVAGVIVVLLCGIGAFFAPLLLERGREITAIRRALEYDSDSSYQKRLGMVQQGLSLWQEAPLFGHGVDAFGGLSGLGMYAHNDYVELLCDLGLVGAFLFYAVHANIAIGAAGLPRSLRLGCWILVLLLLCLDTGSVGYKRKQTVMILMVLGSICQPASARWFGRSKDSGAIPRRTHLLCEPVRS